MAVARDTRSDAEHAELLERLIAEKGIDRYGIYLMSGEGRITPDGFEETSGYVIADYGGAYFLWTGWDDRLQQTHFKTWETTAAQVDWHDDEEYRAARTAAGLT